ncbi:MAG: PD-(D/E)XK nuclease family protein [Sphingobacterium sp.]
MVNSNIENFFREVKVKNELQSKLKEAYRKALTLDFNPLDFVKWNENKVSEIIAFLLDPHASHEQGDLYLRMFVEYFELSFRYTDVSKVCVMLEEHTDDHRRVDIVISYDDFKRVIGIENKIYPWTKDQPFQVADYIRHLKTYCKTDDYHLLYLAPQGKILSKESAGEDYEDNLADGKLKQINYETHMVDLVHRFAIHTDNDRVRSFIRDFELKLREYFIGTNMIEQNDVVKYIKGSAENIRTAFTVVQDLAAVKELLKTDLDRQMNEIADELNIKFDGDHNYFELPNFRKLYARFSLEGGGLIYGLAKKPEFYNEHPDKIFIPEIAAQLKIQFSTSHWWPMWKFLYEKIEVNETMWLDIQSGELKNTIKQFLQNVLALPEDLTKEL